MSILRVYAYGKGSCKELRVLVFSWKNMDHHSGSSGVLVNFTESKGDDDTLDKSLVSRLHQEDDDENSCLQLQPAKKNIKLSNFTDDLLIDIAKWMKKLEDFTCFRSASKFLHVAVKDEYFKGLRLRQGTPYLMLPVRDDGTNDHVRELYSLVEGESTVACLEVPKLKSPTMCYESLGWLLAVQADGSMSLLDPISNMEIPIPHPEALPDYMQYITGEKRMFIKKMVLSSRPNETSDFILMVICGDFSNLAFWRSRKQAWNLMVTLKGGFSDVVYNGGGQFYAINLQGTIMAINLAARQVKSRIIIDLDVNLRIFCNIQNHYLLKTIDGSLLCLKRTKGHKDYLTCEFDAYEIDTETGTTCKVIDSLGSMAVFLGRNSSIAVDASKIPTTVGGVVKANHIYFTDDFWEFQNVYFAGSDWRRVYCGNSRKAKGGCVDSGVFNFKTKAVEPIYPVKPLLSNVCPAMWITPNISF